MCIPKEGGKERMHNANPNGGVYVVLEVAVAVLSQWVGGFL